MHLSPSMISRGGIYFNAIKNSRRRLIMLINIHHDTRWDLPLLNLEETLSYMQNVQNAIIDRLDNEIANEQDSFSYQFGISEVWEP